MRGFVFYLRCLDGSDLETQRQACRRLAGDSGIPWHPGGLASLEGRPESGDD